MGGSKAPWLFSDTQTGCALHPQRVAVAPFPQLSLAPQLSCAHSCWPSHTPVKKVASYCPCSWRGSGDADTPTAALMWNTCACTLLFFPSASWPLGCSTTTWVPFWMENIMGGTCVQIPSHSSRPHFTFLCGHMQLFIISLADTQPTLGEHRTGQSLKN